MRKIIIPLLFVCSMSFGQMFSAQNAECAGCDTTATEVTIGTQTWMRKNLDVVRYNDNTGIQKVTDNAAWAELTTPAYCWFDNDSATYAATYGALYNWYAVNTGKLCPTGYHVPSDAEWTTLTTYLGGESVAGKHLKEIGTIHWATPNLADNSSCFTALSGSWRDYGGHYGYPIIGQAANFWTSTSYNSYAWKRDISSNSIAVNRYYVILKNGFSVRCIKD
jgi:uncharacterized protein (TIGR02145 family)